MTIEEQKEALKKDLGYALGALFSICNAIAPTIIKKVEQDGATKLQTIETLATPPSRQQVKENFAFQTFCRTLNEQGFRPILSAFERSTSPSTGEHQMQATLKLEKAPLLIGTARAFGTTSYKL